VRPEAGPGAAAANGLEQAAGSPPQESNAPSSGRTGATASIAPETAPRMTGNAALVRRVAGPV
jgi:hypothetical protein